MTTNQHLINAGEVFGWFAAVVTVLLGVPQLIKLLKEKRTGNVSFVSFWIFYFGLFAWVVLGTFLPGSLLQTAVANLISIIIYSFTVFYLYYYQYDHSGSKKHSKAKLFNVSTILGVFVLASIAITILCVLNDERINKIDVTIKNTAVSTILGAIVPVFTTFAFMPQLILSFKNRDFGGVSIYMIMLFVFNNVFWIIFWASKIHILQVENKSILPIVIATVWQSASLVIYGIQMIFMLIDRWKKPLAKSHN
ncbi:PQ-loop domain-containing transporter [Mycoplasma sp. 128]|uniref:PQ-loop domain-containing transporter n=1 Tax=Mycoplasma sp. 3341 TaxID=3447506 RepID=UPI003F65CE7E